MRWSSVPREPVMAEVSPAHPWICALGVLVSYATAAAETCGCADAGCVCGALGAR